MAPVTNGRVIFNEVPQGGCLVFPVVGLGIPDILLFVGFPEPGKTLIYDESEKIDVDDVSLDGGFLVKTLDLSVDPYMRGRMRNPEVKSYSVSSFFCSLRAYHL
jgi:hypothetical protein